MDSNFLGINAMPNTTKISSKADALTYAIAVTKTADGLHLDMADRVFRMFLDNIELPNTTEDHQNDFLAQATVALKAIVDEVKKLPSDKAEETTTEAVMDTKTAVE